MAEPKPRHDPDLPAESATAVRRLVVVGSIFAVGWLASEFLLPAGLPDTWRLFGTVVLFGIAGWAMEIKVRSFESQRATGSGPRDGGVNG